MLLGKFTAYFLVFIPHDIIGINLEKLTIVRQGDVDICTFFVKCLDERSGNVSQPTRLCTHSLRQVAHALWKIGDLRSDNENSGLL